MSERCNKHYRVRLTISVLARDDVEMRAVFRKIMDVGPAPRDKIEWELHEVFEDRAPRQVAT